MYYVMLRAGRGEGGRIPKKNINESFIKKEKRAEKKMVEEERGG